MRGLAPWIRREQWMCFTLPYWGFLQDLPFIPRENWEIRVGEMDSMVHKKLTGLQGSEVCDQWHKVRVASHCHKRHNPREWGRLWEEKAVLQKRHNGEKGQHTVWPMGWRKLLFSSRLLKAAFGFRLPGRRKILADFNEGPQSWPWAGHSIWDRLRELGLVKTKKERFVGDLIAVYNQLTRSCARNKASFFLQMQSGRTRGNRYNTQKQKLQIAIMGKNYSEGGETLKYVFCLEIFRSNGTGP